MNWLKVLTKSGRQSTAKTLMDEYITEDTVYKGLADAGTEALKKAAIADDKMGKVNGYVNDGADIITAITKAAADNVFTPEETKDILIKLLTPFGTTVNDALDKAKALVVSKIP